jgi:sRNA-binding protein
VDQFPAVFILERWQPHKPLAIGIDKAMVATGHLKPFEVGLALGSYTKRRMYQQCLSNGGPRYNLDGTVTGEVTADQMAFAKLRLARIDELAALDAAKVQADRKTALKAARAAASSLTTAVSSTMPPVASETSSTIPTTSKTPNLEPSEPPAVSSSTMPTTAETVQRANQTYLGETSGRPEDQHPQSDCAVDAIQPLPLRNEGPQRLSLAGLKLAARERRRAAQAGAA